MYPPQSKKKKFVDGEKPWISYNEFIALGQKGVITKYIQCLFPRFISAPDGYVSICFLQVIKEIEG